MGECAPAGKGFSLVIKKKDSFLLVDKNEQLERLVSLLEKSNKIAIDTEADSLHSYFEKTCLIQITVEFENYIIDPLADLNLDIFFQAIKSKELILHGSDYDLRMLRQSFSFIPKAPIFDTMLAAKLLGYKKLGLAALIEHFFDFELNKNIQKSDWSKRPLSEEQLRYASHDTFFLEKLAEKLEAQLREENRYEWFIEHCCHMVASSGKDKKVNQEELWRVKGYNDLFPSQLVYLKEIWKWRDKIAQQQDVPPFRIMRNHTMINLAKWCRGHNTDNLASFSIRKKKIEENLLPSLKAAIEFAASLPQTQWPAKNRPREKSPYINENRDVVDELKAELTKIADENNLDLSVIISRAKMAQISKILPQSKMELQKNIKLQKWQCDLIAKPTLKITKKYKPCDAD